VWAVLGVGRIGKVDLPIMVSEVVVVRDDDPPGSPADRLLIQGLVRLVGRGVMVSVTGRPDAIAGNGVGLKDVNDLHRHDPALVKELLATASKPALNGYAREAAIDEASRLDNDAYEQGREKIARWLGWRAGLAGALAHSTNRVAAASRNGSKLPATREPRWRTNHGNTQ
jgi:hypothetical protein